jgi:hypothetical protein
MKCERALEILEQNAGRLETERALAEEHILTCGDCRAVYRAVQHLRADAEALPPPPAAGAYERAMRAATRQPPTVRPRRPGFMFGAAVGGALAASVVLALVWALPQYRAPLPAATPQVRLARNETREVRITLETAQAMPNAQISVALSGAIGLAGFEGQKELAWRTDLDKGVNELSLPVVALGAQGGQLVVEVRFGEKSKRFLVDVASAGGNDAA